MRAADLPRYGRKLPRPHAERDTAVRPSFSRLRIGPSYEAPKHSNAILARLSLFMGSVLHRRLQDSGAAA